MPNTSTNIKSFRRRNALGIIAAMAFLVFFAETSQVVSQTLMPIPPHSRTYTGYVRGYWFIAPTDFFILGVRVPTDASSAQQQIQIMRLAGQPPRWAACASNFTTLGYWPNVPGTAMIPTKILVRQGDYIGIIGSRWSSPGNFSSRNSYTPYGNYNTSILGQPTTLRRFIFQGGIMTNPANCVSDNSPGNLGRVELYYGPPCEVPDGNLEASLVDAGGNPQAYSEIPGNVYVKYRVSYPQGETDVTIDLDFFRVGDPSPTPAFTAQVTDQKQAGIELINQQMVSIPGGLTPGYYRVIPTFNTKNSCDEYEDSELEELTLMLVNQGDTPCIVWPGDVTNDGLVNYGDRKGLTNYIHDANLNPTWLNGPARYRSEAAQNPLAYLEWTAQAAVPWATPDGCYMDTDGNGIVNNFDFIAIKMNWMRRHNDLNPKDKPDFSINSFDMSQNFPNPFTPTTQINYSVPERSTVKITVIDMLGREVAVLANGEISSGVRSVTFDGSSLESGSYMAIATMQGLESGLSFSKTIRMTLTK